MIAEQIENINMTRAEKNKKHEKVLMGYEQLLNEEEDEDDEVLLFPDQFEQRNEKIEEEIDISEEYHLRKVPK